MSKLVEMTNKTKEEQEAAVKCLAALIVAENDSVDRWAI